MLLAFVPLYFAVASLAQATVVGAREESARVLGGAIAVHVADALSEAAADHDPAERVRRALQAHLSGAPVVGLCVFSRAGKRIACAGSASDADGEMPAVTYGASARTMDVVSPAGDAVVVTRMHLSEPGGAGSPLVRLVALYMLVFALALLVFAYFALTRLIVRPIDRLVDAADRVASGARTLRVPKAGARELVDLAASVESMASKLIAEEAKLLLTIDEVTETTTRLAHAHAQLARSERMASVGRLVAGLAHEIGNPLAALLGMQELLLAGDLPPETQKDFLERMQRETLRIHGVLRDLLDFARPDEGAARSQRADPNENAGAARSQRADPNENAGAARPPRADPNANAPPAEGAEVASVAADVASLVRPQKTFRGLRVEVDVDGGLRARVAAPRLTQVLLNLVLNAGAAVASLRRPDGRVTIRARATAARVRIEVEDNGPGVASAVRDRIFEPFVTTKDVGEGTGLGLAVCRGLVESVGGEITLDPSYAQGARFVVLLPAADG
jgi:signal transduction histidine kinase